MRVETAAAMAAVGEALGRVARPGDVLALTGDLGAGKTTLVQGLARGLGLADLVTSPTFVVVQRHEGGPIPLVHADLYRVETPRELAEIGLDEALDGAVGAVEWAERFPEALGPDVVHAALHLEADGARTVSLVPGGPGAAAWLARLEAARG